MKFNKWGSLPFCLAGLCVLALSVIPASAQAPIFLKYQVMGVVYAPPGSASNVTYGKSNSVGSTNTFSSTNTSSNTVTSSFSVGQGFLGNGNILTFGLSSEYETSSENSNSVEIQATEGNSISTMGPISSALGVDHDNDVIYIWLNPVMFGSFTTGANSAFTWTGITSNSCDPDSPATVSTFYQTMDGCDPNQYPYPDIVGIPVWCLKNPYYPEEGCSQWLQYTSRAWDTSSWGVDPITKLPLGPGLTLRDYADILQADPFVQLNGSEIDTCNPNIATAGTLTNTFGTTLDPNLSQTIEKPLLPAGTTSVATLDSSLTAAEKTAIGGQLVDYASYTPSAYPTSGGSSSIPAGDANNCAYNNSANTATSVGTAVYRFSPVGTVEYPEPGPNGLPSTYTGSFQTSQTQTDGSISTDTHSVDASFSDTISFGFEAGDTGAVGKFSFGDSNTYTMQQQSQFSGSVNNTFNGSYSITGPQLSDNYVGPATYNVYLDKVYGTFAFYSDLEPLVTPAELGTIEIGITFTAPLPNAPTLTDAPPSSNPCLVTATSPCLSFGPVTVQPAEAPSFAYVYLTNTSSSEITMAGPAVTFSDPGFAIVPVGDYCSNQPVPAGWTCVIEVEFYPLVSDLKSYYGLSVQNPVYANIIAAGTEDVQNTSFSGGTSNQDILVTNYGFVTGTAVPVTSQQATLFPTTLQNSQTSASATSAGTCLDCRNIYIFTTSYSGTTLTVPFTFTNLSTTAGNTMTISNFTLSDTENDFTVTAGATSPCFGTGSVPVAINGGTCNINVNFTPAITSTAATFFTKITANGTVTSSGPVVPLAIAGVAGTQSNSISVTPNVSMSMDSENPCLPTTQDYAPYCFYGDGTIIAVTNTSSYPLTGISVSSITGSIGVSTTGQASITNAPPVSSSTLTECVNVTSSTPLAVGNYCNMAVYVPSPSGNGNGSFVVNATASGATISPSTVQVAWTLTAQCDGPNCPESTPIGITIQGTEQSTATTVPATAATASLTIQPVLTSVVSAASSAGGPAPAASGPAPATGSPSAKLTLAVKVGSFQTTVQTPAGSTAATVAQAVAKALTVLGSPVKATASGAVVTMTSYTKGSAANVAFTVTGNADFTVASSGSALAGGKNATTSTKYDAGLVNLTTNGVTASAQWGEGSTPATVAQALAASVNTVASAYWTATASGDVVTLTGVSSSSAAKGKSPVTLAASIKSSVSKTANTAAAPSVVVTTSDTAGFTPASFGAATN